MASYYRSGRCLMNTNLANSGRVAGYGMSHDDYSEESYGGYRDYKVTVRLPNDEEDTDLNGPVIIIQKGRQKEKSNEEN